MRIANDEERKKELGSNPQLQGQGQQVLSSANNAPRKDKIAVISLTTAKIDVRGEAQSEKQTMEPDEQAQLQNGSKKRLAHQSPESPRSQPEDYEGYNMR